MGKGGFSLEEVKTAWAFHKSSLDLQGLTNKLKSTMSCLHEWSIQKFGSVDKEMNKIKKDLASLLIRNDPRDEHRVSVMPRDRAWS